MIILTPSNTTRTVGQPEDWDETVHGPCGSLPIVDEIDPNTGLHMMWSVWLPTPEDLLLLNSGAAIQLGISGTVHPVVALGVAKPQYDG